MEKGLSVGRSATSSLGSEGSKSVYLDLQAALGITKHMGGLASTEELVELCIIGSGKSFLDVGRGTGKRLPGLSKVRRHSFQG